MDKFTLDRKFNTIKLEIQKKQKQQEEETQKDFYVDAYRNISVALVSGESDLAKDLENRGLAPDDESNSIIDMYHTQAKYQIR